MSTADKLTYLNNTKSLFKDRLNSLGAEITSSTTFRNYLTWLDTFYEEVSDKTDISENGVVGRTSQDSTTGKNLNIFPYGTGGNSNGITFTINNDGTVVLNGTNDGNGNSARIFYNNTNNPMVLEAGRYYIIPPSNTNVVYVMYDGTNYYSFNNNNGYSQLFNSNLSVKQFYVQIAKNNTTTFTNEKIYPMLATTQVTQNDWEPYTGGQPSPNQDYPQSINNLSGNVAYKISGKNLFNVTDLTTISIADNGRATHTTTRDKIIATTGTPSSNSGVYIRNIGQYVDNYDSSKTYNISFDVKASQSLKLKYGQDGGGTITTTTIDTSLTRLSLSILFKPQGFVWYSTNNRNGDIIEISNIMISESEDTTYEKYTGIRTFNIPLKSKNLFDKNTTNKLNGYFERSGDTIHSSGINRVFYLGCKPNTTYAFTKGETNVSNHVFQVASTSEKPDIGVVVENFADRSSHSTYKTFTYTTNANAKYLVIRLRSSDTTNEFLDGVQIEENNEVTSYEPYYDIELCNIDTYEDKIYSSDGRFYLNKETTKYNLFELSYSHNASSTTPVDRTVLVTYNGSYEEGHKTTYFSNIFKSSLQNNSAMPNRIVTNSSSVGAWFLSLADSLTGIVSSDDNTTKVSKIITYLQNKNAVLITYLSSPTTTEITQENYPSLYNTLKQIQDYLTSYKINKEFVLGYSSPEIEY